MKTIKKSDPGARVGQTVEAPCTGNGATGCLATLLVEEEDVFELSPAGLRQGAVYAFRCGECFTVTPMEQPFEGRYPTAAAWASERELNWVGSRMQPIYRVATPEPPKEKPAPVQPKPAWGEPEPFMVYAYTRTCSARGVRDVVEATRIFISHQKAVESETREGHSCIRVGDDQDRIILSNPFEVLVDLDTYRAIREADGKMNWRGSLPPYPVKRLVS